VCPPESPGLQSVIVECVCFRAEGGDSADPRALSPRHGEPAE
jgi:hypothetical protein